MSQLSLHLRRKRAAWKKASRSQSSEAGDESSPVIVRSGPGPRRAAEAARHALESGATALVSWGLAGGLVDLAPTGTAIIPHHIVCQGRATLAADAFWRGKLIRKLGPDFAIDGGRLLSVDRALRSPATKAARALESGAVAADMESAAIGEVAHAAGAPFLVVRVVVDDYTDQLPDSIETWVSETGKIRIAPIARTLLAPRELGLLMVLARRSRVAQRVLARLAGVLMPTNFCCARESDDRCAG